MSHDVFISHAVEDKQVADAVCHALEAEGVRCWIAPRDIPPGMDYEESIVEAISRSPILLLILSTHSNASAHVRREIQCAFVENSPTRVIPFRVEDVPYSKSLSYYLGSAQWIDASAPPIESHLKSLVQNVRARLPQQTAPVQLTTTPSDYARVADQASASSSATTERADKKRPLPLVWIVGGVTALVLVAVVALVLYNLPERREGGPNQNANVNVATPTPQQTPTATPTPQRTPTPTRTPRPNLNIRLPANVVVNRPRRANN